MITRVDNVRIFDGYKMTDQTNVCFDSNGIFTDSNCHADRVLDGHDNFLMPGLIDAHTHPLTRKNTEAFLRNGVTSSFAISAPVDLINIPGSARIFSTHSMALGSTTDGRTFVKNEIRNGADYIKIVVEGKPRMAQMTISQKVMNEIAEETHKNGMLLATHAVSVPSLQMAIEAGTDIYIHVPLEADIPDSMVKQIAKQGSCCVPTLIMMKGFADSFFYGYHRGDYDHAVNNVRKLYKAGVPILSGTDANNVFILPKVCFGYDLHTELKHLSSAGIPNKEVLQATTGSAVVGFHKDSIGEICPGKHADFIMINGDPLYDISDLDKITQVWINGQPIS